MDTKIQESSSPMYKMALHSYPPYLRVPHQPPVDQICNGTILLLLLRNMEKCQDLIVYSWVYKMLNLTSRPAFWQLLL